MTDKQEKDNLDDDSMFYEKKETTNENSENSSDINSEIDSNDEKITADSKTEPEEEKNTNDDKTKSIQDENTQQNEIMPQDDANSALKKYIVQISREFVPIIDSMTLDERIAYINDCIQTKIDWEKQQTVKSKKIQLAMHILIFITVFVLCTPFAIYGVNKAIMLTFENYKYSQENFEKLYKQRFEKDKTYMRSIEYNKKHSIK